MRVIFPCVVRKFTAHVDKKALNMRHQAQKGFRSICVGVTQHQKGYLVYVPSTRKIISPYDVVFGEKYSSTLSYTSQLYAIAMDMRPYVSCIPCDTSPRGETVNIFTLTQFEEGILSSKTRDNAESGEKSDDGSIMPQLISEE